MLRATVQLEGLEEWSVGDRLTDLVVSLGQGKSGSAVRLVVADPGHLVAERVINHTFKSGGIQSIEQPEAPPIEPGTLTPDSGGVVPTGSAGKDPKAVALSIVKAGIAAGLTDPLHFTYILAVAEHETDMGRIMTEEGSKSYFNYLEGRKDLNNNQPGDGYRFRGRGFAQLTGRISYTNWSRILNVDIVGNPEYMTDPAVAARVLAQGCRDGKFTGRKMSTYLGNGKKDVYNSRRVINGIVSSQMPRWLKAFAKWEGAPTAQLIAEAGGGATAPKVTPESTGLDTGNSGATTAQAVVKGNKLIVTIDDVGFEYYHQGTQALSEGRTELTGLGIGFELSRRQRTKTEGKLSLKQLAEKIAKAHGGNLIWNAPSDVNYDHIDQHGLSDYKLLHRLCEQSGYLLRDQGKDIIVSTIANLVDTGIVLIPGLNLLKWEIKDEALGDDAEDEGRSVVQTEQKTELDPAQGTFKAKSVDIDKAKDKAATGAKTDNKQATVAPESQAVVATQVSRTKRLKGLPSTFTIPLSKTSLTLAPLFTVITEGLPGVLSRIWAIDKVEHNLREGTTTLNVYSPVEVLDNTPPSTVAPGETPPQLPASGGYVWPSSGTVTSTQAEIRSVGTSPHIGIDIAAAKGTPIYAPQDGIVNGFTGSGTCVNIKHPDGAVSRLMHMDTRLVRIGQQVKKGQQVGTQGATGRVTGVHCHWDISGLPNNTYKSSGGGIYNYTSAVGLSVPKKGTVIKALTSP